MCEFHARIVHRTTDENIIQADASEYAKWTREAEITRNKRHSARQATPTVEREGHIYYIRIGDVIKIGYASRIMQRLKAYPPSMVLLAVHKGTMQDEAELHARFAAYRRAGREWYDQGETLMAHIKAMRREFGIPDAAVLLPRRMNPRRRSA